MTVRKGSSCAYMNHDTYILVIYIEDKYRVLYVEQLSGWDGCNQMHIQERKMTYRQLYTTIKELEHKHGKKSLARLC
jgi:hypothetical protein